MRITNKTMKKLIGLLSVLVMMISVATASAVQTSAASAGAAVPSVSETAKALINGYVSDSLMGVLVFVIVLLVLALVAVVVVILVISNKKKEANNPAPNSIPSPAPTNAQSFNRVQPMNQPMGQPVNQPMGQPMNQPANQPMGQPMNQPTSRPQAPGNFAQNTPSEKTQFPVDGAGDTTVLGAGSAGFILMRKNGSEKISINKPEFYIGKERAKVDYCITNNNSISRRHAKIKVRAGKCYISDLGSTNCTYINGTKLSPNQEVALIPGDKIKLSNEEFEYIG